MRAAFREEKLYKWLAFAAIAAGVAIRIGVYLQNRNLMIDEANVARNIYERGFTQLWSPLTYEQYAPPLWLWLVKASTLLINMGEQALRLSSMLSGIASLLLLYLILKQLNMLRSAWYALILFASGYIYVRYSTELKQYMTDVAVALTLILAALRMNITDTKPAKFSLLWVVAGSITVWLSMPSVFILAGVGSYYLLSYHQESKLKQAWPIIIAGTVWVIQFALYYLLILKDQANSSYLQNFHKDYFLSARPTTLKEIDHNLSLLGQILGESSGFTFLAKSMHAVFITWSCWVLLRNNRKLFALIVLPLILVLIAAAANQFTLISRVVLFMMPVMLILITMGLDKLLQVKHLYIKALVFTACTICVVNLQVFRFFVTPMEAEQLTDAMELCNKHSITSNALYIHCGAVPPFIYYTTIHPEKQRWKNMADAHQLKWDADYRKLAETSTKPCAFIFTSIYEEDLHNITNTLQQQLKETDKIDKHGCHAYIYTSK
ncbi:MAG: glycosyltransferase family 39 protein [Chitinophagales bacterium]|nr:glycosyltransferase family 39 protein [Chitinophagales bacterium]